MQLNELSSKVDQIASAWESFKDINERRLTEIERKGAADPLTVEQLNKINHSIDEQKSRLNRLEATFSRPGISRNVPAVEGHKAAFLNYLRKGVESELPKYETKALSTAQNDEGGYLVASSLSKQVISSLAESSVMRSLASIETISTDSLDLIEDRGNFASGWVTESDNRTDTAESKIGKRKIYVHEMYAQPKATQKLIDDASIDIGRWITEKIAHSFAKMENESFVYGDGVNQPRGILTLNDDSAVVKSDSKTGDITADSLMYLYYSLESEYAANAKFLMHRNSLQQIRMLKDESSGHYLWAPSLAVGAPDTILGAEVVECSAMPLPKAEAFSVVFADFKEAYKIVDRHDIRVLRDPFTDKPFVKFYATKRVGGDVVNPAAAKILKL